MTPQTYLYVPADQEKKLAGAIGRGSDAVIFDLEDAVRPDRKLLARSILMTWLSQSQFDGGPEVWVRLNNEPSMLNDDIIAALAPGVRGLLLPKTNGASDIARVEDYLFRAESDAGLIGNSVRLIPLIESAKGVLAAEEIAAASSRVSTLGLGEIDLAAELGLRTSKGAAELLPIRLDVVIACAAARIEPPLGPVFSDLSDPEGLATSTDELRRLGFGARPAVHPAQIPVIHRAFMPPDEEVRRARLVVDAFETASASGSGAIRDATGQMIDTATVKEAVSILRSADRPGRRARSQDDE